MPERYTLEDFMEARMVSSRRYALTLIRKGECPKAHWVGRKVFFLKPDWDEWLSNLYK